MKSLLKEYWVKHVEYAQTPYLRSVNIRKIKNACGVQITSVVYGKRKKNTP
jgi:hypothetical protein